MYLKSRIEFTILGSRENEKQNHPFGTGTPNPSSLIKYASECDVLIHDVYSAEGLKGRSEEWKKYHSSVHTSTSELAEIAKKVNPKLLILYHHLFMKRSEDVLLREIVEYYDGKIVSGNDLDVF